MREREMPMAFPGHPCSWHLFPLLIPKFIYKSTAHGEALLSERTEMVSQICVIYFWALGFSPHEGHLQICSINVRTSPVNQVKSPHEDQRAAVKPPRLDALWKFSEYLTHTNMHSQIPKSVLPTPVPRLVFRQRMSLFQRPVGL